MSESIIPVGRGDQYEMLRKPVRDIIDRIYGGKEEFVRAFYPNPLEKYLIVFSAYMADNTTIRVIADRIGIFITIDADSPISFIDGINEYLDLINIEKRRGDNDTVKSIREIINMDLTQFIKLAPTIGIHNNPEYYYGNRLNLVTQFYILGKVDLE